MGDTTAWVDDGLVPAQSPDVLPAAVDGLLVLHDPAAGTSHVLNASAALIWATVDGRSSVRSLVTRLAADTGLPRDVVEPDVRSALAGMLATGVVRPRTPGAVAAPSVPEPRPAPADTPEPAASPAVVPSSIGPVRAAACDLVVRVDDDEIAAAVRQALAALPNPPCPPHAVDAVDLVEVAVRDAGPGAPRRHRVAVADEVVWSSSDRSLVVGRVLAEVNRAVVDASTGVLRLHAAAVERDGEVVVIAGGSGRGKSTLAAALLQRGFRYLTDEVTAIRHDDRGVLPYPKALDLAPRSLALLGLDEAPAHARPSGTAKTPVPVHRLGAVSPGGRVGRLVLLDEEEPSTSSGLPTRVRVLLALISTTFAASFADDGALDALVDIVAATPIQRVDRAPLAAMCDLVVAGPDRAAP